MISKKLFLGAIALSFLTGCVNTTSVSVSKPTVQQEKAYKTNQQHKIKEELLFQYAGWHGTKYKFGGTTKRGVDCSAFIGHVYKDAFNKKLPRTTKDLIHVGQKVAKKDLKVGDMVFFRKGKHVGIYLGDNKFMHSGSKSGVTISNMDKGYYAKNYYSAKRIL